MSTQNRQNSIENSRYFDMLLAFKDLLIQKALIKKMAERYLLYFLSILFESTHFHSYKPYFPFQFESFETIRQSSYCAPPLSFKPITPMIIKSIFVYHSSVKVV